MKYEELTIEQKKIIFYYLNEIMADYYSSVTGFCEFPVQFARYMGTEILKLEEDIKNK